MANVDAQTNVLNYDAWRRAATRQLSRDLRRSLASALLVLDIDHFKRLNDEQGHMAGNVFLEKVGDYLVAATRASDIVGRIGGDEFAIFLSGSDASNAKRVAERIREAFELGAIDAGRRTTISIGVAGAPEAGATLVALFENADGAMYRSKRSGRNLVSLQP